MWNRISATIMATLLVAVPTALAQEAGTIHLRNGKQVSGDIIDYGGVGFTIRAGGGERVIPTGDVVYVDFAGGGATPEEASKVGGGQHVLVLRDGGLLKGKFLDIGGTHPLRITFEADGQPHDFRSSYVARIYLARPSLAAPAPAPKPAQASEIIVSGRQRWTLTGIRVLANQTMNVQASGTIGLSTDPNDEATPAGAKSGRTAPAALVTGAPAGALIGRIGTNGQPFLIGDQTEVTMPATGLLYLSVNDGYLDDNNGEFRVRLWPQ
jgi:hypothetical protein